MAYINGNEVVFGAYIHGGSGNVEWNHVITRISDISLADQLDMASGRVLVKGIGVLTDITIPSAVTLIEFIDCAFETKYETQPDGDGNGGGITVEHYCNNITGHSNCTIRGVAPVIDTEYQTRLIISGFGAVEHCFSGNNRRLVVKNCERVLHCSLDSVSNTKFISDCSIISEFIGSISGCSNINNVYADAEGSDRQGIEFFDCHNIVNVQGGVKLDFNDCSHISNVTADTVTYTDCTYVDPFTCKDFVSADDNGKAIALTTDGTFVTLQSAEEVWF